MAEGRIVFLIENVDRQIRILRTRGGLQDFLHLERLVHDRDQLHSELRRVRDAGAP